jgi:hypothetical protein
VGAVVVKLEGEEEVGMKREGGAESLQALI